MEEDEGQSHKQGSATTRGSRRRGRAWSHAPLHLAHPADAQETDDLELAEPRALLHAERHQTRGTQTFHRGAVGEGIRFMLISGERVRTTTTRDLIQAYFARFLEKNYLGDVHPDSGRFRSFLLASLKHFVANERDKSRELKRHPGTTLVSLDLETADGRFRVEPADDLTPERVYEKRWATTVLELAC